MEGSTMSTLLTELGTVVTQMFVWVGNTVTAIMDNDILLLGFGIWITGAAIGLFGRLLSRG